MVGKPTLMTSTSLHTKALPTKNTHPNDLFPSVLAQGKGFSLQLPGVLQEANQGFKASHGFDDFGEVAGEPQKLRRF